MAVKYLGWKEITGLIKRCHNQQPSILLFTSELFFSVIFNLLKIIDEKFLKKSKI